MNALHQATTAYAAAAAPIRTNQGTEYDAFAQITHRLTRALHAGRQAFPALAEALHDNRRLWTILAADVADGANSLPRELRAQIFYLAEFTLQHTAKVLNGTAKPDALVEINTAIMRGLRGQGRSVMTGLVLKLGPHERVLVNGAVIENGARRGRFSILTPNAHILRLKDALPPEEANTPVRRVCYIAQLVLSGDADPGEARQQLLRGIEQLSQVFIDADSRTQLQAAADCVVEDRFYPALKALRSLIAREERLFAAAGGGP